MLALHADKDIVDPYSTCGIVGLCREEGLVEIANLTYNFYLSEAAHVAVSSCLSSRYTSIELGRLATDKHQLQKRIV